MSATYAFLSWLRRGMATAITSAPAGARATIGVITSLNDGSLTATTRLALLGPGDITGVDPLAVIRTWPRPDVYDAASHYLPLLEFDQADLPWRYTPAPADAQGRVQPWCCLITLKSNEYERTRTPDARNPLPAIRVVAAPLPKLGQSWAWAHVQVSGAKSVTGAQADQLLTTEPRRLLARLLCPRRLEPRTTYSAFLVPTFRRGVLAGLGGPVPDTVPALEPAWADPQTGPTELPVYYEWSFQTAAAEDFEALVRKLKKAPPPSGAGKRDLDVSAPGLGRVAAASHPLGLEGVLKLPGATNSGWHQAERNAWIASLKPLVDSPTNLPGVTVLVAPPLYGRWHAPRHTLGSPPTWFDEVNADPRLRVIAAVGVEIVRSQQEQLIASAWQQVEGIRALNAELRQAQLAREVARRMYARHVAADDLEVVLQLTAPLNGRVREAASATATVRKRLRLPESPLPPGILMPQWRRIRRPLGPIGRRQDRAAAPRLHQTLTQLNRGELQLAPAPYTPEGLVNLAALRIRQGVSVGDLQGAHGGGPGFEPREYLPERGARPAEPPIQPVGGPDSPAGQTFRAAVLAAWPWLTGTPAPQVVQQANLAAVKDRLVTELDPNMVFAEVYAGRLTVDPELHWDPVDVLEPVMASPRFPQPMMEPLRALSQEWIFPGLDKVPPNSMCLLEVNRAFINAYLLGLNYEMARELLWNEYPTDQRGTYFRQFWDPASYLAPPGQSVNPKQLEDIDPIDQWPTSKPLESAGKQTILAANPLVLLLRGDLLARYPNTVLYAVNGKLKASPPTGSNPVAPNDREPDFAVERHPLFVGMLQPDVAYFAFQLDRYEVLGIDPNFPPHQPRRHLTSPAGWYFVLQEQPSEARFGLNATPSNTKPECVRWDDLAWDDLTAPVAVGQYIDLLANTPPAAKTPSSTNNPEGAVWGRRAADMAFISLQRQVRLAVHASDMIQP